MRFFAGDYHSNNRKRPNGKNANLASCGLSLSLLSTLPPTNPIDSKQCVACMGRAGAGRAFACRFLMFTIICCMDTGALLAAGRIAAAICCASNLACDRGQAGKCP